MKYVCSLLLLSLFFYACKKDNPNPESLPEDDIALVDPVYDTIFPLSYFPAYPGSFWNYSDSINYTVADAYKKTRYYSWSQWPDPHYGYAGGEYTYKYLPQVYMGEAAKKIHGYEYLPGSELCATKPVKFFDPISTAWSSNSGLCGNAFYVINRDTAIEVNGVLMENLVCVKTTNTDPAPSDFFSTYEFYKEGIGMVRRNWRNYADSTWESKELIDYFINN